MRHGYVKPEAIKVVKRLAPDPFVACERCGSRKPKDAPCKVA